MRTYTSFIKKEFTENLRTYKTFIMGIVFLLFGIMSPALAKVTPDLMKSLNVQGMTIEMPAPTAFDSWGQFFKNVGQLGLIVLVIVFCGIMANEFSKGTLINILTKGMKRSTVILSKFTVATVIWTLSYLLCFAVTYYYTGLLWSMDGMHNVFLSFFSMWLYGELLISLVILGGILFKNVIGSLLFTGGVIIVLSTINIADVIKKFNPVTLSGVNLELLKGNPDIPDLIPAVIICSAAIVVLTVVSIVTFNKKQV